VGTTREQAETLSQQIDTLLAEGGDAAQWQALRSALQEFSNQNRPEPSQVEPGLIDAVGMPGDEANATQAQSLILHEPNPQGHIGPIVEVNETACQRYGYSRAQFQQMTVADITVDPTRIERFSEFYRQLCDQGQLTFASEHVDAAGRRFPVEVTAYRLTLDQRALICSIVRDLTPRSAQPTRSIQEQQLGLTLEAARVGTWLWDIAARRISWSTNLQRLHGLAPGSFGGSYADFLATVHADDRERVDAAIQQSIQAQTECRIEYRYLRADGSVGWLEARGRLTYDDRGQPAQMVGIGMDVTDRKQAEQALRDSEERFRRAVEGSPNPIMIHAEDGEVLYLSRAWLDVTGYTRSELTTVDAWVRRAYGSRAGELRAKIRSAFDQERTQLNYLEVPVTTRDGDQRTWLFSIAPLGHLDDGRAVRISTATDITDRLEAEAEARQHREQVAHIARVHTLGEMATGLAHELNQPLAAATNYIEGSLHRLREEDIDPTVCDGLQRAMDQTRRAGDIVKYIRAMTSKREPDEQPLSLPQILDEAMTLAKEQARQHDAFFDVSLPDDLPHVRGDRIQIEQVILNLMHNAIEAIAGLDARQSPDRRCIALSAEPVNGQQVQITVRDYGPGMSQQQLNYIFHPFFTTKRTGMGMGLNICQSIVEAHGGRLWTEPAEPCGMRFHLTLPVAG
jgi:PAS domain S-box-containing protein